MPRIILSLLLNALFLMPLPICVYGKKIKYSPSTLYLLEGTVASGPVAMFLQLPKNKGGVIRGFYYYHKYKEPIPLKGNFTNKNDLEFSEFTADNKTNGIFKGSFDPAKGFFGLWIRGANNLPVQLKPASGALQKITFFRKELEDKKPGMGFASELGTVEISLSYTHPLLDNPNKNPVIDRINGELGARTEKEVLEFLDDQVQGSYGSNWIELPSEDRYNTDLQEDWEFITLNQMFLGIAHDTYSYYGGAHGSSYRRYRVFSMETGAPISNVKEILLNPEDPKLMALLQKKLLDWMGENEDESRESFFDFNSIRLNDNFMIVEKGVNFLYNQYEIAPYAYGAPEVFFSFDELRPFLKKGGTLNYLLK